MKEAIKTKRRKKLWAGVFLLLLVHSGQVVVAEVANCSFELLPHPSYSPDLALFDIFLFPKLKSYLRGCYFGNNDVDEFWGDMDANCNWTVTFEHRWIKCIDVKGDYIEK